MNGRQRRVRSPTSSFDGPVATQESEDNHTHLREHGNLVFYRQNSTVWLSHLREGWVPAIVVSVENDNIITVRATSVEQSSRNRHSRFLIEQGKAIKVDLGSKEHPNVLPRQAKPMRKEASSSRLDVLAHLHEASVLHNIRRRFKLNQIYSSTGLMLLAMNPYKELDLYSVRTMNEYRGEKLFADDLPPHLFEIAGRAYEIFKKEGLNQSLIICGESGAGKTESTKLILRYLSTTASKAGRGNIENQILESNPLMEAFGNAKTIRNQNSSRFGKYIHVQMGPTGWILGAYVKNYLLEKSRVSTQPEGERNYHIFYQLLNGLDDDSLSSYSLNRDAKKYHYLNQSGCLSVGGLSDSIEFQKTLTAMIALNLGVSVRKNIFAIVAAILHLGNTRIVTEESEDLEHGAAKIANLDTFTTACSLLGIDSKKLENGLTLKLRTVLGATSATPLKVPEAVQARDALAKNLYNTMFGWLVARINETIGATTTVKGFIGVLDIYGFENLNTNGFEQLLINYTNEKMQHLFNERVFQMEEEVYRLEGVPSIKYSMETDNCLSLIEDHRHGLLSLVNEQSMLGIAGSDAALAAKINFAYSGTGSFPNVHFIQSSRAGIQNMFTIKHYAGDITYCTDGFVMKNKDTLASSILNIFVSSTNTVVAEMHELNKKAKQLQQQGHSRNRKVSALQTTVTKRFRSQLSQLMQTLKETQTQFIRCIRSNEDCLPNTIDPVAVLRQLKYSGVMEALRVRRLGYSSRLSFKEFVIRYRMLLNDNAFVRDVRHDLVSLEEIKRAAVRIFNHEVCEINKLGKKSYQLGHTLIFLRAYVLGVLDVINSGMGDYYANVIQRLVKTYLQSRRFARAKTAAQLLQKHIRGLQARQAHNKMVFEIKRKAESLQREMAARKQREEEAQIMETAKSVVHDSQVALDDLREVVDVEGKRLMLVDRDAMALLERSASEIEKALGKYDDGANSFLLAAKRAHEMIKKSMEYFATLKVKREEEYHTRRLREAQLAAAQKQRDKMNEASENARMKREEDLTRLYGRQLLKIELMKEDSERYAMKREEEHQRWVRSELLRIERSREESETRRMRKVEIDQREMEDKIMTIKAIEKERLAREEMQREFVERHRMEAEEAYQKWLKNEMRRLAELRYKENLKKDREIGREELKRMAKEEERQLGYNKAMRESFQRSLTIFKRIEEERQAAEIRSMHTFEQEQKMVEKMIRQQEIDKRNMDHEKILMQSEDMSSKMFSLNESIGSRMIIIRRFERTLGGFTTPTATVKDDDPFALVRSMTNDLERHTSSLRKVNRRPPQHSEQDLIHSVPPENLSVSNVSIMEDLIEDGRKRSSTELLGQLEFQIMATSSVFSSRNDGGAATSPADKENKNTVISSEGDADHSQHAISTNIETNWDEVETLFTTAKTHDTTSLAVSREAYAKVRAEAQFFLDMADLLPEISPEDGENPLNVEDLSVFDRSSDNTGPRKRSLRHSGSKEAQDLEILEQAANLMSRRHRGMSVFGPDFLFSSMAPSSIEEEMNASSHVHRKSSANDVLDKERKSKKSVIFRGQGNSEVAIDANSQNLSKEYVDDLFETKMVEFSEIDDFISRNFPRHIRTPERETPEKSLERLPLPKSSSQPTWNTKEISTWRKVPNYISEDTEDLELLRIRRNVSHLTLHGAYPTTIEEVHTSRIIPACLIGKDLNFDNSKYLYSDDEETNDDDVLVASSKFLRRVRIDHGERDD